MKELDEAREAVQNEVVEFHKMRVMVNTSPLLYDGTHQLDISTMVSQLVVVVAKTHQSVMKLLIALEALEAKCSP